MLTENCDKRINLNSLNKLWIYLHTLFGSGTHIVCPRTRYLSTTIKFCVLSGRWSLCRLNIALLIFYQRALFFNVIVPFCFVSFSHLYSGLSFGDNTMLVWQCTTYVQSGAVGFNTGNGEKLSNSQAVCLVGCDWLMLSFSPLLVSNSAAPPCTSFFCPWICTRRIRAAKPF